MRCIPIALLFSCAYPAPPVAPGPKVTYDEAAVSGVVHPALRDVIGQHWEAGLRRHPVWATELGDHRYDDRLTDPSDAAMEAWRQTVRRARDKAAAIPEDALQGEDVTHRAMFVEDLDGALAQEVCQFEAWSFSPRFNPLQDANVLPESHPVVSPKDGRNLVARYSQIAPAIDTAIRRLRVGLGQGLVVNRQSADLVIEMFDRQFDTPLEDWPLMAPAAAEHPEWPAPVAAGHTEAVRAAVTESIQPALHRYRDFVADEVAPLARAEGQDGIGALPMGEDCYEALILNHTTLPLTADEIHRTGRESLKGIHEEFRVLGKRLFDTDDLAEIFRILRTDPDLRFTTSEEVEEKARASLARAQAVMGETFGVLPQLPCEVLAIPDFEAPYTTIAYYRPGSAEADRIGAYFINTYAPETRPKFEAEVLAYHEAIPGHHLQIAIAQEIEELPAFRKHGGWTAFVEGWALYTERLAEEMGLYTGDLDRMGVLSFDAWRAARLVVDTGMHAKGWSRTQGESFLMENTPLAENNVRNEIDRYITWPGQALAYKTGQIHLLDLRAHAETELGDRFDLASFHDAVLGGGAVPLRVLTERVNRWIDEQAKGG
jgi:uncharacterized protein (DUF885 family)